MLSNLRLLCALGASVVKLFCHIKVKILPAAPPVRAGMRPPARSYTGGGEGAQTLTEGSTIGLPFTVS